MNIGGCEVWRFWRWQTWNCSSAACLHSLILAVMAIGCSNFLEDKDFGIVDFGGYDYWRL